MPARPDAAGSGARLVSEANGGVTASIGTTSTTRRRRRQASLGVRSHTASKYGVAVVFVGVAATLNGAAPHTFGLPSPFLLYYPPLLAAALLGGLGPGVLATLLGALSTLYFNVEPVHSFKWGGPADALRLAFFVFFGVLVSYLSQILRNQSRILRDEAKYEQDDDAQFRLAVQEMRDYAIFMLDVSGVVRSWNDGAERAKGYTAEEIIGQHFSRFYPPEHAVEKSRRALELAARHGRHEDEGWRVRKDGSRFWANAIITAIRTPGGKLIGFAKVTRDLSERRANDEALRESREALREKAEHLARSNADLEQFAYVASHDLQEPLRMVTSFMELLKKRHGGQLDAEAGEFIAFAIDGATRMKQLLTDLLAYSRVSGAPSAVSPIDAEAVLRDALLNLELAVKESQAVVTHDALPRVAAERLQMVQLFQNLIANSIKFRGAAAPRVHVSARRAETEWVFSVRDHGIGIDPEHSERIFQLFQRLHARTEYPGTGIGLAICKKIVERHGGRIWVESQLGSGATFFFTLPAGAPEAGKERDHEQSRQSTTD